MRVFTIPQKLKSETFGPNVPDVYISNDDHQRNFIECVKSRQEPAAPVEIGHRSASICHLGNIALKLKAKLKKWDPARERFVDNDEANSLLHRSVRETWSA
jgi:hypothetical protein